VQGKECQKGKHRGNPHCSPTVSSSPTGAPNGSPTASVSPIPTTQATSSPTSSPTASNTPEPEVSSGVAQRTDLTDGRSDGRTQSLGCLRPEDGCNTARNSEPRVLGAILPATGDTSLQDKVFWGAVGLFLGLILHFSAKFLEGNDV